MATYTSSRRPLGRPRPSLGHSNIITASSPSLSSSYASPKQPPLPQSTSSGRHPSGGAFNRKVSLGPTSSAALSPIDDESEGYGITQTEEGGSSPFTMHPPKPIFARAGSSYDKTGNQNLEVGDTVDVPGGMHGTIKFIGEVRGKMGVFAGVELSKEWAARGKNDGDVDGIRYFTTSIPGAGIFLPSNKAYKRLSPGLSSPKTPSTPVGDINVPGSRGKASFEARPRPIAQSKFSQSVGPGRAQSPALKPKSRPSLPRPESPLRKGQNSISTPIGRPSIGGPKLSKSVIGASKHVASPTPNKFGASIGGPGRDTINGGDPSKRQPMTPKPAIKKPANPRSQSRSESRSESRLGPEPTFDEDSDNTPIGVAKFAQNGLQSRSRPVSNQDDEVKQLRQRLKERDKQLDKYASDLEEMQSSIAELQTVTPKHQSTATTRSSRGSGIDDSDASSLRALVREKNEKIATLTQDFDTHRADFRDTIDILEHTSDETNRMYEQKIESLRVDIRELQDRGDDVESVAQQLKQLEQLVEDLEEGLEDARRGEAEARGEVEFLRGEVERCRSELQREREKAATALKGANANMDGNLSSKRSSREVEEKDDQIRALKAVINSLSRNAVPEMGSPKLSRSLSKQRHSGQAEPQRQAREQLEREVKELESLVDSKTYREEELELEIQRLRKITAHVSSSSNGISERTIVGNNSHRFSDGAPPSSSIHNPNLNKNSSVDWPGQVSPDTKRHGAHPGSMAESDSHSTTMTDSSNLWCEICEIGGHDILTCTNINGDHPEDHNPDSQSHNPASASYRTDRDVVMEGLKTLTVSPPPSHDLPVPLSPAQSPRMKPDAVTPTAQQARMPNPMDSGAVAGKERGVVDAEKWCALCERDGHDSTDCPFDDAY